MNFYLDRNVPICEDDADDPSDCSNFEHIGVSSRDNSSPWDGCSYVSDA